MGKAMKVDPDAKKSGPKGWATPEQLAWLQERLPEYHIAKDSKSLQAFWLTLNDWFIKWLEPEPVMLPAPSDEPQQASEDILAEKVAARKTVSCHVM
jgi:hypothetical protein